MTTAEMHDGAADRRRATDAGRARWATGPVGRVANSEPVRLARWVGQVVRGCVAYAVVSRRVSLLLAVVVGLGLLAIGLAGQAAAPFVVYPFV